MLRVSLTRMSGKRLQQICRPEPAKVRCRGGNRLEHQRSYSTKAAGKGICYLRFELPQPHTDKRGKGKKLRDWLKTAYVRYEETENYQGYLQPLTLGRVTLRSVGTIQKRGISEDFYVEPPIINSCYNEILKSGCCSG
jgi:hypothetical protein